MSKQHITKNSKLKQALEAKEIVEANKQKLKDELREEFISKGLDDKLLILYDKLTKIEENIEFEIKEDIERAFDDIRHLQRQTVNNDDYY